MNAEEGGEGNHSQIRVNIEKYEFTPGNCTKTRLKASSRKSCFIRNEFGILIVIASGIL